MPAKVGLSGIPGTSDRERGVGSREDLQAIDIDPASSAASPDRGSACGISPPVKIVGVDEVDLSKGHVSWISPMVRAVVRAFEGDVVRMRTPAGEEEIEIVKVEYV